MIGYLQQDEEDNHNPQSVRGVRLMKLNPPKKSIFWAAVIFAAAGMLSYAYHLITLYIFRAYQPHFQMIAFVLVSIGFVLLLLGLTRKGA